ncbi:MAG TPA: ABC transporter permease, partial [Bacteroidales bacterium]|nr:ABC transporter permease [Bacteroidales bacterium]
MNLSLFIAKRYLISKKKHNIINIISAISVIGVAVGTMALVIVLSVFNGLESLIKSLFNTFEPDLKITLIEGKTFS